MKGNPSCLKLPRLKTSPSTDNKWRQVFHFCCNVFRCNVLSCNVRTCNVFSCNVLIYSTAGKFKRFQEQKVFHYFKEISLEQLEFKGISHEISRTNTLKIKPYIYFLFLIYNNQNFIGCLELEIVILNIE